MAANVKILICVFILAFSGCQSNKGSKNQIDSLTSAKWIFLGIRHTDTNIMELKPASLKRMDVVFSSTKQMQANSACNIFYGDFLTSGSNSIKIENLSMTKMFCMEDTIQLWETRYFEGFKSSDIFNLKGDTLTINGGSKFSMVFKAER